jgi:LAO/AO transport system kinase
MADVLVLLLQPETGDDLQWEKAGVLEVADVIFVQKADLPGAERVEAQVRATLGLSHRVQAKVLRGSAKTGAGVAELWDAITACPLRNHPAGQDTRELLRAAQEVLAQRLAMAEAAADPRLARLLARWAEQQVSRVEAAGALLQLLAVPDGSSQTGEREEVRPPV